MSPTETIEKPTQTDIYIPQQRIEEFPQEVEISIEKPPLPEPGIGDFDLVRSRSRLSKVARLSGYMVVGPRIHIRRG